MRVLAFTVATLGICAGPGLASAQPEPAEPSAAPGYVVRVDGDVELVSAGTSELPAPGLILTPGDRVATRLGRVELRWDEDGQSLFVNRDSAVDVMGADLLRLERGEIVVELSDPGDRPPLSVRVDSLAGSATLQAPGRYRVTARDEEAAARLELAVFRGAAQLAGSGPLMPLRAGEQAVVVEGQAPELPTAFNVARLDAFDRWTDETPLAPTAPGDETRLPDALGAYGPVLDRHGTWDQDPDYGAVWYPRATAADWRPYYDGRWQAAGSYGYVWIGADPWSWPTHHYGRWQLSHRGRWFWIPARGWRGAWVSWTYAPGYVGWCPLGWNGRPVVAFSVRAGGSHDGVGVWGGYGWDPWQVWTVVPHTILTARRDVPRYRLGSSHFGREIPAFVASTRPPPQYRRGGRYTSADAWAGDFDARPQRRVGPGVTGAVPRGVPRDPEATIAPDVRSRRGLGVEGRAPAPTRPRAVPRDGGRGAPMSDSPYDRARRVVDGGLWPSAPDVQRRAPSSDGVPSTDVDRGYSRRPSFREPRPGPSSRDASPSRRTPGDRAEPPGAVADPPARGGDRAVPRSPRGAPRGGDAPEAAAPGGQEGGAARGGARVRRPPA
jgi:hypothetical protein